SLEMSCGWAYVADGSKRMPKGGATVTVCHQYGPSDCSVCTACIAKKRTAADLVGGGRPHVTSGALRWRRICAPTSGWRRRSFRADAPSKKRPHRSGDSRVVLVNTLFWKILVTRVK